MSENAKTYRQDLYYVNFSEGIYRKERIVRKLVWWFYRLQIWRFAKMIEFNVLYEGERCPPQRKCQRRGDK